MAAKGRDGGLVNDLGREASQNLSFPHAWQVDGKSLLVSPTWMDEKPGFKEKGELGPADKSYYPQGREPSWPSGLTPMQRISPRMAQRFAGAVHCRIPTAGEWAAACKLTNPTQGANLRDQALTWRLEPDGEYLRASVDPDAFSAHTYFMTNPSLSGRGSALDRARSGPRLVTGKAEH